ncbi:unnamed protein product [Rotaria sordida]|uniref:DUF6570 domain-containing protein n=2 Tax=Rotaria sordida TaxID=392033 RepID=A0A815LDB1_9BILA|nr:unnamed protein product [Rotaria sordida]
MDKENTSSIVCVPLNLSANEPINLGANEPVILDDNESLIDNNELLVLAKNKPVIRVHNRTFVRSNNKSFTRDHSKGLVSGNNEPVLFEKGIRGAVVTVNRLKHYAFIKRKDKVESRDIFAREASIINELHQKKLFISDSCKFDTIKTARGIEAVNIKIEERHINTQRRNEEFKTEDNKRRADAHKVERQDDEFKKEENKKRAEALKIARHDNEFKTEENKRRADAHKIERQDDEFKEEERRRNVLRMHNSRDKYKSNFDSMKSNYESKIKEGPTHICSCCGGLWFEYSIREYTVEMLTNKGLKAEFINTVCYLKHAVIKLCVTCRKDIVLGKIPNLCLSNGLAFYEVPDCLKILTELEERLISPRIPFMVIRTLGFCKQFGLKGNLVNVPMNVDTNVSILPRSFSDTHTIQLKLMRQMKNKNAFMYETIRPKVVHTAIKYLVEQELYKDEGIVISNNWLNEYSNKRENFVVNDEDKKFVENENTGKGFDDDDNWNECDDKPMNPGATETLTK